MNRKGLWSLIVAGLFALGAAPANAAATLQQVQQFLNSGVNTNLTIDFPAPPAGTQLFAKSYAGPIDVAGIAEFAPHAVGESSPDYIAAVYLSRTERALGKRDPAQWLLQNYSIAEFQAPSAAFVPEWETWGNNQFTRLTSLTWTSPGVRTHTDQNGTSSIWRFERTGGASDPNQLTIIYIDIVHQERTPQMIIRRYQFSHFNG
jgi:hypothetical protein